MVKYIQGFLIGLFVGGLIISTIFRTNLARIDGDFRPVQRDFEEVQRALGTVSDSADGFADDISTVNDTSTDLNERGDTIASGLGEIRQSITVASGKVDEVEEFNRQIIIVGREFGEVNADFRKLNKQYKD